MVWGPNIGVGYPYGANIAVPSTSPENLQRMDTNGDNVINNLDDPYLPYWPGEQYVDWIAMSAYNYGSDPNGQTTVAPLNSFVSRSGASSFIGQDELHNLVIIT
jgi:hypothetical protein